MSGTGPSTENIAFDSGHGKPVTLKEELPGYPGVGSAPPTDEFDDPPLVKRTERVETTRVSKPVGNGDEGDSELKQKLLVAGALVAAGVAIVFGVRQLRGEEQPEETKNWAQRKAKEAKHEAKHAKHEAKHAAKETKEAGGDAGEWVNEKSGGLLDSASDAAHKVGSKAHDAYETVADKVDDLRHDAKDKVEAETKHADKRAASPAADLESRRMTYGQDKHGVPKGLTEDAGFLGYKNWLPFARTK